MRFVISNDVCISVTLVDDASSKNLIELEAPSLFVAMQCHVDLCMIQCVWLIVSLRSVSFMGWDRPFRTSLDRRWTMTFCFGRRCEFDKVGLFSSALMVPIASALLVVIRIGSGNEVCHLERRLHFCYPCR